MELFFYSIVKDLGNESFENELIAIENFFVDLDGSYNFSMKKKPDFVSILPKSSRMSSFAYNKEGKLIKALYNKSKGGDSYGFRVEDLSFVFVETQGYYEINHFSLGKKEDRYIFSIKIDHIENDSVSNNPLIFPSKRSRLPS